MNAKEARDILMIGNDVGSSIKGARITMSGVVTDLQGAKARGYLEALNGEEVRGLVEALESISNSDGLSNNYSMTTADYALSKFRAMTSGDGK